GPALLVADRVTGQLFEIGGDKPMRSGLATKAPMGAFRIGERWAVVLEGAGNAVVVDLRAERLEATATIALGGGVSDAAVSPDGRTLLVALGGAARERGASTAVISGDPPVLAAKLETGLGSHAVSFAPSGEQAVVCATWARSLAILRPKP
ncbi:MAG TPA: hypothetical protein VGM56_01025, partial [Byssovorax sp.]